MTNVSPTSQTKLRPGKRLLLVVVGIVGLALLITARRLEPDPRGFGTHEQLGLTPCFFLVKTGHVCPACGTTTAWAHLLRGEIGQAASANLGGTLLCLATLCSVPWLLVVAMAGRWLAVQPSWPLLLGIGSAWLGVTLLDWLRRWVLG